MKTGTRLVGLAVILLGGPGLTVADRAHNLVKVASTQKAATGCNPAMLTITDCHQRFPTGCTNSRFPYDAYLNFLKNQVPDGTWVSTGMLVEADFRTLEARIPLSMTRENHAKFGPHLADLGEGNIVTVIAYLYFVADTGKGFLGQPAIGETCNCKLQLPGSYDFHLGLGFDAMLASQIRMKRPQAVLGKPTAMDKTSVVAEMTPHTWGPRWTFARVSSLQGQQVKVVGQLMADNAHLNPHDDCGFRDANANCWRSTVWEIHPISELYVCNLSSGCDRSSPDSAWTALDNIP